MDEGDFMQTLWDLSPWHLAEAHRAAVADRVASAFRSDPTLIYRGVIGMGYSGAALLFLRVDNHRRPVEKIVVKYSLFPLADAPLRNEAFWLTELQGAEHISQRIEMANTDVNTTGIQRPTLALKYIENGTMVTFIKRYKKDHSSLPNRFLWRLLACQLQHCIAMGYPPRLPLGAPLQRETIVPDEPYFPLNQNSPHGENLVFGDLVPGDPHHNLVPRIHLIDFDRATMHVDSAHAWDLNLSFMMLQFQYVALLLDDIGEMEVEEPHMRWRDAIRGNIVEYDTMADERFLALPFLDRSLRNLVARCTALPEEHRPTLEELQLMIEAGLERTAKDINDDLPVKLPYAEYQRESDQSLRDIAYKYILNAPGPDAKFPSDRPIPDHADTRVLPSPPQPQIHAQPKTLLQRFVEWLIG
ncbi:hypothetical protein F5B19DRAFT_492002 [Rostrohypoxylon terebratum]|nr:hypothetical protein F5B19DRAFT_492002 [Rostrohypoxylon terebratum]